MQIAALNEFVENISQMHVVHAGTQNLAQFNFANNSKFAKLKTRKIISAIQYVPIAVIHT